MWSLRVPDLLRMQTLYYEIQGLDVQIASSEAELASTESGPEIDEGDAESTT